MGNRVYIGKRVDWTPAEISTVVWYDAADSNTITVETGVSQWNDKSGNNNHATQSTPSKQPATGSRTIGGKNVLDFDEANRQFLTITNEFDFIDKTLFAVAITDEVGTAHILGGKTGQPTTANTQLRFYAEDSVSPNLNFAGNKNPWNNDTQGRNISNQTVSVGSANICQWNGGDPAGFVLNGTVDSNTYVRNGVSPFYMGNIGTFDSGNSGSLNGAIGEIIVLPSIPDDVTRQKIEGYLAWKWGLA